MLVLSRKEGQAILIPELGIRISVQRLTATTARIGIAAPRKYTVLREELQPNQTDGTIAVSVLPAGEADGSATVG